MKLRNYALRCIAVACAIVFVACVDESYDLADVSTEVTIGQGNTKLPIGELEYKSIKDLLGENKIEGLEIDENGNFSFSYKGEGEPISIEGVENSFTVPGIDNTFTVVYPSFDLDMPSIVIDENDVVSINADELYGHISSLSGNLPEFVASAIPNIEGSFNKTFSGDDMHLLIDLPEQVANIKKVVFKDVESGHHGAPLHFTVDFNGLHDINGGGDVYFDVAITGGKFRIVDENNNLVCEGNEYEKKYSVEPGAESVDFVIYVESIENTTSLNSNHQLDIPLELTCNLNFDLDVKAGSFDLSDLPHFTLFADFEFGDAQMIASNSASLVEYHPSNPQKINVKNLPSELKSINNISFEEGTALNFYADGLEWLGDNAEKVIVDVVLPEYFVIHAVPGAGYSYDSKSHVLTTTIADINDGVELALDSIDFGTSGLSPNAEGTISLDFLFDINAYFVEGEYITISSLMHDMGLEITTGIEDIDLKVKSISGKVDYSYDLEQSFMFKTDDYDFGELFIEGSGMSPIISLNIDNPLTLPLTAEASISDDTGRKLDLGHITLKAAEYNNGVVKAVRNTIIIASEERRKEFNGEDIIFVSVDFDELLEGVLPSQLDIDMSIGISSDKVYTLYMSDAFEVNYDYALNLPISFNDDLSIAYGDEFTGFNDLFTQIAEYDVEVGDITLIAEIENTLPLALEAEVVMIDADGKNVDIDVVLEEGYDRINGSKDGSTPAESTLRINIGNGRGINPAKLATVDGFAFKLKAESDADGSVDINADQGVAAKLSLELDGGITVDIEKLMQSNN